MVIFGKPHTTMQLSITQYLIPAPRPGEQVASPSAALPGRLPEANKRDLATSDSTTNTQPINTVSAANTPPSNSTTPSTTTLAQRALDDSAALCEEGRSAEAELGDNGTAVASGIEWQEVSQVGRTVARIRSVGIPLTGSLAKRFPRYAKGFKVPLTGKWGDILEPVKVILWCNTHNWHKREILSCIGQYCSEQACAGLVKVQRCGLDPARRFELICQNVTAATTLLSSLHNACALEPDRLHDWRAARGRTWKQRQAYRESRTPTLVRASEQPMPQTVRSENYFAVLGQATNEVDQAEGGKSHSGNAKAGGRGTKHLNRVRVGAWNVFGLSAAKAMEATSTALKSNIGVLGVVETRLSANYRAPFVRDWTWFGTNRSRGAGFYIHRSLSPFVSELPEMKLTCGKWIRIRARRSHQSASKTRPVHICLVYMEVELSKEEYNARLDEVTERIREYESAGPVLLIGDFNARIGNSKNHPELQAFVSEDGEDCVTPAGRCLLDFARDRGFFCLNGRRAQLPHTFFKKGRGVSVIDYAFVSQADRALFSGLVIEPEKDVHTDHALIWTELKGISVRKPVVRRAAATRWNQKKVVLPPGASMTGSELPLDHPNSPVIVRLRADCNVRFTHFKIPESEENPTEVWTKLYGELCAVADTHLGRVSPCTTLPAWWDKEVRAAVVARRKAYGALRKLAKAGQCSDEEIDAAHTEYMERAVTASTLVKKKRRECDQVKLKSIDEKFFSDKAEFWRELRYLGYGVKSNKLIPLEDANGFTHSQGEEALKLWAAYFAALGNETSVNAQFAEFHTQVLSDVERAAEKGWEEGCIPSAKQALPFATGPFSREEFLDALHLMKNGKAYTDVPAELLKAGGGSLHRALLAFCNLCWATEKLPEKWLEGTVVPIAKVPVPTSAGDYRGITLLSIVGKLFLRMIQKRMTEALESTNSLINEQAGFRQGRSTTQQTYSLYESLWRRRNERKTTFVCFVDIRKAYDRVWRKGLWYKLYMLGFRGKLLRVLSQLYSNVRSNVRIDGELSEPFGINIGLRQGCVLSPLLFLVFVNDLLEGMAAKNTGIRIVARDREGNRVEVGLVGLLFADDLVIEAGSMEDLEAALQCLTEWCGRWQLDVNEAKTKVMVVVPAGEQTPTLPPGRFTVQGKPIGQTSVYEYLGTLICDDLSWDKEIRERQKQIRQKVQHIHRVLAEQAISVPARLAVFSAVVDSTALWGSEIWNVDAKSVMPIERARKEGLRKILMAPRSVASEFLFAELRVMPALIAVRESKLRFLHRLLSLPNGSIAGRLAHMSGKGMGPGQRTWVLRAERLAKEWEIDPGRAANYVPERGEALLWDIMVRGVAVQRTLKAVAAGCESKTTLSEYVNLLRGDSWSDLPAYLCLPKSYGRYLLVRARSGTLALNAKLHKMGYADRDRCPACESAPETLRHILTECSCGNYKTATESFFSLLGGRLEKISDLSPYLKSRIVREAKATVATNDLSVFHGGITEKIVTLLRESSAETVKAVRQAFAWEAGHLLETVMILRKGVLALSTSPVSGNAKTNNPPGAQGPFRSMVPRG